MSTTDGNIGDTGSPTKNKKEVDKKPQPTRNNNNNKYPVIKQAKFEGECDDLKGHIYDCSDARQSDIYVKTNKAIAGHVGRTYKYSGDIRSVVDNLTLPTFTEPTDPPADATRTGVRIWEKQVDEYVRRDTELRENIKTLYSLVWGQCTDIMRQKLEALDTFETISTTSNGLDLLKAIKTIVFQFQSQKYLPHALHEAKRRFYMCYQGKFTTTAIYLEQFQNMIDVIQQSGGGIGDDQGIIDSLIAERNFDVTTCTAAELEALEKDAQQQYLSVAFILGSDRSRYGRLIENLENDFLQGQNSYPKTVTAAYNLITNWKQDIRNLMRAIGPIVNDGVNFANVAGEDGHTMVQKGNGSNNLMKKTPPPDKSTITCYKCNTKGHYSNECPDEEQDLKKKKLVLLC